MVKWKTKAIQTEIGIFRHNQVYPGIIQDYSGISKTLCNSGISRTVVFTEPLHIQNQQHIQYPGISQPGDIKKPSIFRTLEYSKSDAYSEPCQTSMMKNFAKLVNGYNYFAKLFLQYKVACLVLYFIK